MRRAWQGFRDTPAEDVQPECNREETSDKSNVRGLPQNTGTQKLRKDGGANDWSPGDKNVYPAFNYQQMIGLHHTKADLKFLFLPYMALNREVISALKAHPEVVIIAQSNHPNRLGEFRGMLFEMMEEGLTNPVVFFQHYQEEGAEDLQIKSAADMGALLFDGRNG